MTVILLIEDEDMVRATVRVQLKSAKLEVIEASNGVEGIELFRQHKVDLVITDIIMPEKEGIGVIREIREINPKARILAMSGGGRTNNFEFLKHARTLGASAAIQKPFSRKQLLEAVIACLSG